MAEGGIRVTAKRRLGQFLIMQPVSVSVDGAPVGTARWSRPTQFETSAGPHELTVGFPYLGKRLVGVATLRVEVTADEMVDVVYRSPWIVTMRGSLQVR